MLPSEATAPMIRGMEITTASEAPRMNTYELKIGRERGYYVEATSRVEAISTGRRMARDGEFGTDARENCYRVSVVAGPRDKGTVSDVTLRRISAPLNEERFDAILDGVKIGEVSSHLRARHITEGGGSDKVWSYRLNPETSGLSFRECRTMPAASKTSARDQLRSAFMQGRS